MVILVLYDAPSRFLRRQLALAVLLGKPVIRWWVGTDVLCVGRDHAIRRAAAQLNKIVRAHIVVAPHLREELASVGVTATFVPSLLDPGSTSVSDGPRPKSLLVYLPSARKTFYGFDIVQEAVRLNPDVEFIVVADETHSLASYPNVRSLGWVSDLSSVWDAAGGLLRITSHDGMPRMVLEALRRGKHVIYSWPLPGCRLARNREDVQAAIGDFRTCETANRSAAAAVRELLEPDPAIRFAQVLESALASPALLLRLRAALIATADTIRLKLQLKAERVFRLIARVGGSLESGRREK